MAGSVSLPEGGLAQARSAVVARPRPPPIREELILHAGPPTRDGAPTWTLEDPARARFFRIGWAEVEMLARWVAGDPAAIARAVSAATTLTLRAADVEAFVRFLSGADLLRSHGPEANARLLEKARAGRMGPLKALLKNYLFFRVPLARPDRFLDATSPLAAPFFHPAFWIATAIAGLVGLFLALRRWDEFATTFLHVFTLEGALLAGVALLFAKALHELAHAYAAKREGLPVPTMGVALMVLYPVLYTDTTAAWRVPDRARRLRIGYAGMAIELALAAWMTLLWSFLPDGPARSAVFVLATTTWIMTLAVNLNPFMRFDGYFLFSDAIDTPNLQDRAFRLARWRLREALFGFGEPPPEVFPRSRARLLVAYAVATWIYRFVLFLGIALLVYHFFFKALGIVLMIVELAWFIGRPIALELREWASRREKYALNRNTLTSLGGLALVIALFAAPLHWPIHAPALMRPERQTRIFAPADARLATIHAEPGDEVIAGAPLYRFESPDMDHRLAEIERRITLLRWRAGAEVEATGGRANREAIWRELEGAISERDALRALAARLSVDAPHDGLLAERDEETQPRDWVAEGEWLATVISPDRALVEAYLAEADLARVAPGSAARFYPEAPGRAPIALAVLDIATTATRRLESAPELASDFGGGIAAHLRAEEITPDGAVYRVLLAPRDPAAPTAIALRGTVRMEGERQSIAARLWRAGVAIVVRESGF
ncbi:MAG: HlyD family efflux transporter periplasmic adaptor subunit [Microvirga sp.]|nr:HlyD family efflux transporter periplasmic adaptor subunit [Microvirga sp.]